MRKAQFLINEARMNTNTTDCESITDYLCVSFLNRAQEFIQAYLFTQNIEAKIFRKSYVLTTSQGVESYDLPLDVYAKNSINNVMYKNGDAYSPMKQIAEKARGTTNGYFLSDSSIVLSPMPQFTQSLNISYTRRLPSMSLVYGTITGIVDDVKILVAIGPEDTPMESLDDKFCVIGTDGTIVASHLPIIQDGDDLLVSDTSLIQVGMLVVIGEYSTTYSQLPNELESALIMSLEVMINARMSSKDIKTSKPVSDEMLAQIGSMFADNTTDSFMPPVVEYSEWV